MKIYKITNNEEIYLTKETLDSHSNVIKAISKLTNKEIGYVQYIKNNNNITIPYIKVIKAFERQGIGSKLIAELMRLENIPYQKINWELVTNDGEQLKKVLDSKYGPAPFNTYKSASTQTTQEDYRIPHQAPNKDDYPLYDLKDVYPDDIYSSHGAQYYGHYGQNHPLDVEAIRKIQWAHNKPNAQITIYRAVPANLTNIDKIEDLEKQKAYILKFGQIPKHISTKLDKSDYYDYLCDELDKLRNMPPQPSQPKMNINPGDWVTLNRAYAKEHGEDNLNGNYQIISKVVNVKDLYTDGSSIQEWGYNP